MRFIELFEDITISSVPITGGPVQLKMADITRSGVKSGHETGDRELVQANNSFKNSGNVILNIDAESVNTIEIRDCWPFNYTSDGNWPRLKSALRIAFQKSDGVNASVDFSTGTSHGLVGSIGSPTASSYDTVNSNYYFSRFRISGPSKTAQGVTLSIADGCLLYTSDAADE